MVVCLSLKGNNKGGGGGVTDPFYRREPLSHFNVKEPK